MPASKRVSTWIFFPSVYPRSQSPRQKGSSIDPDLPAFLKPERYPSTGIFRACCAWMEEKVNTTRAAITEPRNRRVIELSPVNLLKSHACFLCALPRAYSLFSFDYPIRPRQHVRRNRQADLFGGVQVD